MKTTRHENTKSVISLGGKTYAILPPTKDNYTTLKEVMRTDVEGLNEIIDFVNEDMIPHYEYLIRESLLKGYKYHHGADHWWIDDDRITLRIEPVGDNFQLSITAYSNKFVDTGSRKEAKALKMAYLKMAQKENA